MFKQYAAEITGGMYSPGTTSATIVEHLSGLLDDITGISPQRSGHHTSVSPQKNLTAGKEMMYNVAGQRIDPERSTGMHPDASSGIYLHQTRNGVQTIRIGTDR